MFKVIILGIDVPETIGDEKFKYVVRTLITLIKYEERSRNPTISELISEAKNFLSSIVKPYVLIIEGLKP